MVTPFKESARLDEVGTTHSLESRRRNDDEAVEKDEASFDSLKVDDRELRKRFRRVSARNMRADEQYISQCKRRCDENGTVKGTLLLEVRSHFPLPVCRTQILGVFMIACCVLYI
jgi:hypothetical protein